MIEETLNIDLEKMKNKSDLVHHADRIRSMSNEELTKFIKAVRCSYQFSDSSCGTPFCQSMNGDYCFGLKDSVDQDILEWLNTKIICEEVLKNSNNKSEIETEE